MLREPAMRVILAAASVDNAVNAYESAIADSEKVIRMIGRGEE
jgi:hypothetical protein